MIEGTRSWADNLFAMMLDTDKIQDLRCDLPLGTKWNMWAPSGHDKCNAFPINMSPQLSINEAAAGDE